ncbi:Transcription factor HIVEP2 [Armadillidium vulgare]|nr:Transcription factor HIVEP2 [Armadillidium vulgare]
MIVKVKEGCGIATKSHNPKPRHSYYLKCWLFSNLFQIASRTLNGDAESLVVQETAEGVGMTLNRFSSSSRVCPYCYRSFGQNVDLQRHIRTHTGEKPYLCTHCPFRAAVKSSVTRHKRSIHGISDYSVIEI